MPHLPQIPRVDGDAVRKAIEEHAAPGPVRGVRLNLHGVTGQVFGAANEQKRQDAGAGAQIAHPAAGSDPGKICQQHRVHPEAEPVRRLDNAKPHQLQIVHALAWQQQIHFTVHSAKTPGISSCNSR